MYYKTTSISTAKIDWIHDKFGNANVGGPIGTVISSANASRAVDIVHNLRFGRRG